MKRSVGVTLIAVLSLIGSGLMLLFGTLTLVGLAFAPIPRSAQFPESPVVFRIILLASSLAYFLPAVWGIVTGIGLLRLKNWARISTIVFSALLTLMSGFTVLVTLLLPMPARPSSHLDSSMMSLVRLALAGFWGVQLGIGIWWLAFFNRAKVREQFVPTAAPLSPGALPEGAPARRSFPVSTLGRGASRRPLSITILAWFLLVGSLFIPFGIPMRTPAILFTTVVSGWPAALLLLTFTGLQLWIGIGLLRLRAAARLAAIVYFAFGS